MYDFISVVVISTTIAFSLVVKIKTLHYFQIHSMHNLPFNYHRYLLKFQTRWHYTYSASASGKHCTRRITKLFALNCASVRDSQFKMSLVSITHLTICLSAGPGVCF